MDETEPSGSQSRAERLKAKRLNDASAEPWPDGRHGELPGAFLDREFKQIQRHRDATGAGRVEQRDMVPGLAISGGGIRSAVFSLGVMQALSEEGVLNQFSYMSTVSGGTYMGAFYGSLFVPDTLRKNALQDIDKAEFEEAATDAARRIQPKTPPQGSRAITPIEYLRNNCNYLLPNGFNDALDSLIFSGKNWFAVQYMLGVTIISVLLIVHLLTHFLQVRYQILKGINLYVEAKMLLCAAAVLAVVGLSPLSRAFWLTQNLAQERNWLGRILPFVSLLIIAASAYKVITVEEEFHIGVFLNWQGDALIQAIAKVVLMSAALGFLYFLVAYGLTALRIPFEGNAVDALDSRPFVDRVRNRLSNAYTADITIGPIRLTGFTQILVMLLVLAAIEALGELFVRSYFTVPICEIAGQTASHGPFVKIATLGGISGSVWTAAKFLLPKVASAERNWGRLPLYVTAAAAALIAALAALCFWAALAKIIVLIAETNCKNYNSEFLRPQSQSQVPLSLPIITAILVLVAIVDGFCIQFLNLSTYQRLFSGRLTRTFLGASNRQRLRYDGQRDVTALLPGDSLSIKQYFDPKICAPVHLINVTINKTVDWSSSLVHRTARGLGMSVGPAGITIGAQLGVLLCDWPESDDLSTSATYLSDPGPKSGCAATSINDICLESLTLGDWIAISGAAVSTGLGAMTNPGYAFLLGIANIRLGYWWDTCCNRRDARKGGRVRIPMPNSSQLGSPIWESFLGTQLRLVDELMGKFDGPRARRWYLTDGGHFDNTGAYELLRRQLKFIVLVDNGADPELTFSDVANLQTLVRVDLGVEIMESNEEYQSPASFRDILDTSRIALSIDDFKENKRKVAVRFVTAFPDGSAGMMLVIKPRLVNDAPYAVRQYGQVMRNFPQETTANQFFDERQWEHHRALGQFETALLFRSKLPPSPPDAVPFDAEKLYGDD